MRLDAIAIVALCAAAPAAPAPHDVWEADLILPDRSPVYVLQRDVELDDAMAHLDAGWIDVVDAKGRTMPRGYVVLPNAPGGPHRFVWFDDVGSPPYHIRVGAKSARREDPISNADQERLGLIAAPMDRAPLPLASVRNRRTTGTFHEIAPQPTAEAEQARNTRWVAVMVAALAALAVAALAAADHAIRRKIAAVDDRRP